MAKHAQRDRSVGARILTILFGGLVLAALAATPAQAAPVEFTVDGIRYSVDPAAPDSTAGASVITGDTVRFGHLTIPDTVEYNGTDYPVVAVVADAFAGRDQESVSLPVSLVAIGAGAFSSNRLDIVSIPPGVTTIGAGAFSNNRLYSVSIPPGVTTIEAGAFSNNWLGSVSIPSGVTTIEAGAFSNNWLGSVSIPSGVTTIEAGAFSNNRLRSVSIPPGVTTIGASAFRDNADLSSVHFLGPAPSITAAGDTGSFGPAEGKTLTYLLRQGGGFTTPEWNGYVTTGLATVTFDLAGRGDPIDPVLVPVNTLLTAPPAPTADGYTFTGWYPAEPEPEPEPAAAAAVQVAAAEEPAVAPFDFATPVTADLVLRAGWAEDVTDTEPPTTTPTTSDTVTPGTITTGSPSTVITPIASTTADPTATAGHTTTGAPSTTAGVTTTATTTGPQLAKTGSGVLGLASVALLMLLLGAAVIRGSRAAAGHRA